MSDDIFGPVFIGGICLIFAGVVSAFIVAQMVEATDSYDELADAAFKEMRGDFAADEKRRQKQAEKEKAFSDAASANKQDPSPGIVRFDDD